MAVRLPRMRSEDVAHVLAKHGFDLISQHGSHQKWRNTRDGKQVIVPVHKEHQMPLGTMKSIINGSGIPEEQFHL